MFDNIKISARDLVWEKILTDLGAIITDDGISIDLPAGAISFSELNDIINAAVHQRIQTLGAESLTDAEKKLILMLPGSAAELKTLLGYSADAETHSVETLVYNIRQKLGQDFIKRNDGTYNLPSLRAGK